MARTQILRLACILDLLHQNKHTYQNLLTQNSGTTCRSFPVLLLATNGKNTVVILWIGCGASAVHQCPPPSAGFPFAVG